jgi:hypothetical protein
MQAGVYIKDIYACISWITASGLWGDKLDNTLEESAVIYESGSASAERSQIKGIRFCFIGFAERIGPFLIPAFLFQVLEFADFFSHRLWLG